MTKLQRNNTGHRGGFSVLFTKGDLKYCNRCKKELKLIEERVESVEKMGRTTEKAHCFRTKRLTEKSGSNNVKTRKEKAKIFLI